MRSLFSKALILGVAVSAISALGCSASASKSDAQQSDENMGTVGLALQIGTNITVNTFNYAITGNGVNKSGSIDVTSGTSSSMIGGIPAGTAYNLSLNGTSTDGYSTCAGTATFNITAQTTTQVSIHLQCRQGRSGGVGITPNVNICPNLNSISATPNTAVVGNAIAISANAVDPDNSPSPLSYAWTASSGTIANAAAASTTFTCTAAGTVTISLAISDGDCGDSGSVTVTCNNPPPTTQSILTAKSAACYACAQTNGCLQSTCETVSGNAVNGPAAGTAKTTLCTDALSCVITTKCATGGTGTPCYCGTASGAACLGAGAANGVCKSQEERGLELTDPASIAAGFGDPSKAAGVANSIVQCLNDAACSDCF